MTEPSYLADTRDSYDKVAASYAELVPPLFADWALGRAMLAAFVELVRPKELPVADVGCGPGFVTAYLASLGLSAYGIDLSPAMVRIASETYPDLRFEVGTMTALEIPDATLGGLVAWWSILHVPPADLPTVLAEFHRTLAPGGHVALGFHVGDGSKHFDEAYGVSGVSYDTYFFQPDHLTELLADAGLDVIAKLTMKGERRPQACLLASKPS